MLIHKTINDRYKEFNAINIDSNARLILLQEGLLFTTNIRRHGNRKLPINVNCEGINPPLSDSPIPSSRYKEPWDSHLEVDTEEFRTEGAATNRRKGRARLLKVSQTATFLSMDV